MEQIRRRLPFVRPYWGRAAAALLFLAALVFMELAIPRLIQRIIDEGISRSDGRVVLQTSFWMLALALASAICAVANNVLSVQVSEAVGRDLRDAIFTKIQALSLAELEGQKTGRLMVRLTSDTGAVLRLVLISLRIGTRAPLLMAGSLFLMVATSPELALAVLPFLALTFGLILLFVARMGPLFGAVQERLDRLNTLLQENIAGVRLVRSFARSDYEFGRFTAANDDLARRAALAMRLAGFMSPALVFCVNVAVVIVVWLGGLRAAAGGPSVGQIVAFSNYLLATMMPLVMTAVLSNIWAAGTASAGRINEVLGLEPSLVDAPEALDLPVHTPGRVVFENVSFGYSEVRPVLEGIDLDIEAGGTVAILGATGCGKTTLVNLIPRFYDARAGRVLIDGVDVRRLKRDSLLSRVGFVPQEAVLFSGTIRDNIRYGRPEASEEEVVAAARTAQAHEFITALPQGYESRVEERGANLSGGQRQRLAIARALLIKPRILILDDATSAVDAATEARIHEALAALPDKPTTIIVAQRISTVLEAQRIVLLDQGRIAGQGTHAELMVRSPLYREIFSSQLGDGTPWPAQGGEGEAWGGKPGGLL